MSKQPRHRPRRSFPNAKRVIVECELEKCIHCGEPLVPSKTWHMRKTVQAMDGPLFVAGKSKKCTNPECRHFGEHYHASGVLRISLPYSTYGLDELGFIPFSPVGAQLIFQFCSTLYERVAMTVTTNLRFADWTQVFGDERLTAALLDRLTHKAHILEFVGESYRFRERMQREAREEKNNG